MKVSAQNIESGKEFQIESDGVNGDFLEKMSVFKMSDEKIKELIGNLNISADAKSLLYSFSKATIIAGKKIINIGKKIIDFICYLFEEYTSATFGMIFGAIAGVLVSTIPILGVLLGPLLAPIAIFLGLTSGFYQDIKDKNLARRVAEINAEFSPLNA